ncbi:DUF1499 domain-containing protein [Psychromonas sp. KJ10-10]|uniref:DUF1499 domain-containing protein n=1 Tax=Psychromonas sp. KJ10-10 TaxID=3391823 RepID=UPI0039B4694B
MKKKITLTISSLMLLMGCSGTSPKLGTENKQLLACPNTPNCVSSYETDKEHAIESLKFKGDQQATQSLLLKVLQDYKGAKIITNNEHYIRAEFTSLIFRFVDDVEFYFPEANANETIIQVRSASRIGHSDLGANRKRIEAIRQQLTK